MVLYGFWYCLVWFGMVWVLFGLGMVWYGTGRGGISGNDLQYSRMF